MKINNLPEYAKDCKYIVVRLVDNEVWFWGAYEDLEKAYQSASEINGIVVLKGKEPFINKPCCISNEVCEHDKQKVLDKVRAEIDRCGSIMVSYSVARDTKTDKGIERLVWDIVQQAKEQVLEIIDKYRAEIEVK